MTERKITKLLIANRGELRSGLSGRPRTAGIQTVAVYADSDRNSQHVKLADEAYALNGESAAETYLVIEKYFPLQESGADAIHPATDSCQKTLSSLKRLSTQT